MQKSERSGVSSALEASHQRLNRLVWVVKSNKKTGKPEDRLLAITNHRVVTYKKSAVGAIKECQNGHLYDLNTIVYQHENEMELHFKDWFIKFSHFEANSLFKLIVEQVNRICCRWPKIACPTIDANALLLEAAAIVPFDGSMNNGAPEFLETYRALCSSYDVPAVPDFLRKATLAHTANSHTIRADWHGDQITLGHVQALIGSLLHDKWFDDVSLCLGAADKSIKTMDVIADTLGPALSRMASIKSLSFAHSRLQANGAEIIISSLAANRSMDLRHLDFSFNQLGDRVVKQLVHVLGSCFPRLQSLNLAAVGLTGRGLSDMLDDLVGSIELSKGIETISLAHNTLGKRVCSTPQKCFFLLSCALLIVVLVFRCCQSNRIEHFCTWFRLQVSHIMPTNSLCAFMPPHSCILGRRGSRSFPVHARLWKWAETFRHFFHRY